MAIRSIRHSAIVVSDLEKSLQFYQGVLELELYQRFTERGEFVDQLTGLQNVELEWAKLVIPSGGLIELLQYHSHPDNQNVFVHGAASNKMGASHIALTVDDLDKIYSDLKRAGFRTKSPVLLAPNGQVKILYAHDPDGAILELIEDL